MGEMLEHKADDDEIGGHGDAQHGKRRHQAVETNPQEEIEQTQLQKVIEDVGACKTCAVACRGVLAEREVGREVVISQKTEQVAYRIGDVDIDKMLQQPIDGQMDGRGQCAHDTKANDLTECFFFLHQ